ncbi:uncharacterized beta-barrel protein YwiB (DUF1934 family) [Pullulanibacillus pueri]|uniref:DUF1934 domain-containing protein n=1 Tax=Pullulanibacillus pueri TaxID=1437324 RepID=A0A8J2ZYR1_9BACL|nr:DUF1934 domain-containing protein [Pullulanibacillus pueri]MBM7681692.1 uncharacterized beta-barrel protein YwiB (DUF1934 family) [Pullulanibacillus pueri]GGH87032.1 hypothetical protein GCM10007096_36110 [Pullulanibacillus pueri]
MESQITVDIRLKSEMKAADMPLERTLLHTKGLLNIKDDVYYLRYQEEVEGVGSAHHTIKIKGDEALILRRGPVALRQPLKLGESLEGTYKSPVGNMQTVTHMNKCLVNWQGSKKSGYFVLGYQLSMQGQAIGQFTLTFKLREAKQ